MCGICGALSFGGEEVLTPVAGMVPLMVRRGPDDGGLWCDPGRCTLGFRRLAILDLSPAGHQPMESRDGRYCLVYNGELYNFRDLRRELEQEGVVFDSSGDTQVVLHALIRWGREGLGRFNGMFALALYDRRAGRLLLARDHAGIKPLYCLRGKEGFVFASQYDQLLAHPMSRDCAVDRAALALYLRLAYIPAPRAILAGSRAVAAGGWMEVETDGTVRDGRFFTFPSYQEPTLRGAAAWEAVDAAVEKAVARQLISDVPVGVFLSGGIDSPLVAAKVRAAGGGGVKAFTISTGGDGFDEGADAVAYAREIGIDHVVREIREADCLALLDDVVAACGEPFGDYSIFPTLLVCRLAREAVTVMLSGDGGDELFWGYAERFASVVQAAPDFGQPLWLRRGRWAAHRTLGLGGGYWQLAYPSVGDWYRAKHSHLEEGDLRQLFPEFPAWPAACTLFDYHGHDRDATAQWCRWNEFTGRMAMILAKVDRASMYSSLEVRVPLLDREVVEVAGQVAWESCLDLGQRLGKLPLRHALRRHVGHHTVAKRGFTVPMGRWLRGPLRSLVEERVVERDELLGLPLNRRAARALFRGFLDGKDCAWGIWLLLSLALWEEHHLASRGTAPPAGER